MTDAGPYPDAAGAAGGLLTIDLDALAANWRTLRDRARGAECAAVVKADAYGIGIEPAVRALARAGCKTFFVAHLTEAVRARAVAAAGHDLRAERAPARHGLRLTPSMRSGRCSARATKIDEWAAFCRGQGEGGCRPRSTSIPA